MVSVRESGMFSGEVSRVAHLPQKMVSVGLGNWHFGHLMDKMISFNAYIVQKKNINLQKECQYFWW